MPKVIGYTYDADCHCVSCAQKRFAIPARYKVRRFFHIEVDENGINPVALDSENNPIHPIFNTDEHPPEGEYCGTCRCVIVEPVQS